MSPVGLRAPVRSSLAGARCDAPAAVSRRRLRSASAPRSAPRSLALAAMLPRLSADERLGERLRLEGREVVGPLPQPDELHRDAQLALHGDDDAALGGA